MRKYIRHPSDIPITYDLVDVVFDQKDYLKNISVGGLCFCSRMCLKEGTTIQIKIPLATPIFEGEGVVIWCHQKDSHYEVGVQFIDENTGFRARMVEQVCHIEHYKREILETEGRELTGEEAAVEWITKFAKDFPLIDKT